MKEYYTITVDDVGKSTLRAFGRNWPTTDFIGRPQPRDVGKRVFLVDGILQVENDEQRDHRMSKDEA